MFLGNSTNISHLEKVAVIATDGSFYVGILEGYDHSTNIALRETVRRTITNDVTVPSSDEHLGLFVIRGDCVSSIGKVDAKLDARIDWTLVHGETLKRAR